MGRPRTRQHGPLKGYKFPDSLKELMQRECRMNKARGIHPQNIQKLLEDAISKRYNRPLDYTPPTGAS